MAMAVDSFHTQITSSGTAIKDLVLKLGMKALSGAIIWVPLRSERWTDIVRDGDEIRLHLGSARGGCSETSRPLKYEPMTPEPLPPREEPLTAPKIPVQLRKGRFQLREEPREPPKIPLPPREESPTIRKRPLQLREEPREPPKIPLPPREQSPTIRKWPLQLREEPREPPKIPLPPREGSPTIRIRPLQLREESREPPKIPLQLRDEQAPLKNTRLPWEHWEEPLGPPKQSRNQSRTTNRAQNTTSEQERVQCPNQ